MLQGTSCRTYVHVNMWSIRYVTYQAYYMIKQVCEYKRGVSIDHTYVVNVTDHKTGVAGVARLVL